MKSIRITIVAAALAAATVVPGVADARPTYKVGQSCKRSKEKQYNAKGFTCVRTHGKWKLKRQSMTF